MEVHNVVYTVVTFICRFTPEEKGKRHPCAYMPFGYGPRSCIGMRFALLEAKMALIEIVSKFRIVLAPETKVKWSGLNVTASWQVGIPLLHHLVACAPLPELL